MILVTDAAGNAVGNASVQLLPPATGPSVTSSALEAVTDANGLASFTLAAANAPGPLTAQLRVAGATAQSTASFVNTLGDANRLVLLGGGGQATVAGASFAAPLTARVTDTYGNPVPGAGITLVLPTSGPSISAAASTWTSDGNGVVSVPIVAGTAAGELNAKLRLTIPASADPNALSADPNDPNGVSPDPNYPTARVVDVFYPLVVQAAAATRLSYVGGSGQVATVQQGLGSALVVRVVDVYGNPAANTNVTFLAPSGAASLQQAGYTVVSDGNGLCVLQPGVNAVAGSYYVQASLANDPNGVYFAVTNVPGAPNSLVLLSGDQQSATVGTSTAQPLVFLALDAANNPVPNVWVDVRAPQDGATGALDAGGSTTDAGGQLQVAVTAGQKAGSWRVTASIAGISGRATALATCRNVADVPASLVVVSGDQQSTTVLQPAAAPFVARVSDAYGNAVGGALVQFVAPPLGASMQVDAAAQASSATGLVAVRGIANRTAGAYSIAASVVGGGPGVSFVGVKSAAEQAPSLPCQATISRFRWARLSARRCAPMWPMPTTTPSSGPLSPLRWAQTAFLQRCQTLPWRPTLRGRPAPTPRRVVWWVSSRSPLGWWGCRTSSLRWLRSPDPWPSCGSTKRRKVWRLRSRRRLRCRCGSSQATRLATPCPAWTSR